MTTPARPPRPAVAILELEPTGHRLEYVRHLAAAAGPERCVVLTSERARASQEYATHLAPTAATAAVLPGTGSRRAALAAAVAHALAAGAVTLVVPEGDHYLAPLLALMVRRPGLPLRVRLLLMRTQAIGGAERPRLAMVAKPVLVQLLRPFRQVRVLFLTDALGVVTRRRGFPGVRGVRDPVERADEAGAERPRWFPPPDPGTTLVGVFGVISARKNLPLLVEAMSSAPETVVVVGGRVEPEVRALLDSDAARALIRAGRLVVMDRMLGPAEFGAALASVDVVAVLHDNDAPSGILAEACLRGTPMVVPAGAWLAEVVGSTGIGVATGLTGPAIAGSIRRVTRDRRDHVEAARRQAGRLGTAHFTSGLLAR